MTRNVIAAGNGTGVKADRAYYSVSRVLAMGLLLVLLPACSFVETTSPPFTPKALLVSPTLTLSPPQSPTATSLPASSTLAMPLATLVTPSTAPLSLVPYRQFANLGYPVALSPSGEYIATYTVGRYEVEVALFEVVTGKTIWEWPIPEEDMANSGGLVGENALVFSPDGKELAVGGNEGLIYLLDAATGTLLKKQRHTYRIVWLAFAAAGQRIIAGSCSDTTGKGLTVWNLEDNSAVHWPVRVCGDKMAILPDKPLLLTTDLISINYETGITDTVRIPDRDVVEMALSPDGRILAAYSSDRSNGWKNSVVKLELWDLATDTRISWPAWKDDQTGLLDLAWSTSNVLAVLSDDGTVAAWDMRSQAMIGVAHVNGAEYVLFSPDGSLLAAGRPDRNGPVQIWNLLRR